MSFFESAFLWKEAVISSIACAAALSVIGMYTVLRRVVFLPSALSQVSGAGVMLSFLAASWFPGRSDSFILHPFLWALLITLASAFVLGGFRERSGLSRETAIGIVFVAASALITIVGARVPNESHAIEDVLFGNAVLVSLPQLTAAVGVSVAVLLGHVLFFHSFVFVSMDPQTARAQGIPIRTFDGALFLSMGIIIASATKTIGALPVFAYTVLPPSTALLWFHKTSRAFIAAPVIGAASAFLGYYISFTLDLPTGACATLTATGFLTFSGVFSRVFQKQRNRLCK